jgi:hypothetical protein
MAVNQTVHRLEFTMQTEIEVLETRETPGILWGGKGR